MAHLRRLGFFPDYECDLSDFGPGVFLFGAQKVEGVDTFLSSVETAFARLNLQMCGLQRTLRTRMSELAAADRHIAKLEEKLLKLKKAQRDLECSSSRRSRRCANRRSERSGRSFLAPYRLPAKVDSEKCANVGARAETTYNRSAAAAAYQKWLEHHRTHAAEASRDKERSARFVYQPLISIITPVFQHAGLLAGRNSRVSPATGLRKIGS